MVQGDGLPGYLPASTVVAVLVHATVVLGLQFLPERHTDFIFAVLSEEWGFLGSAGVLALYCFLVLWGLDIAAKAKDSFGRLLAVGLTSILFFHVVVNVGMATGMLQVVGVPLPLFSYGGSSVVTTFLITGILLSIRFHRFARSR
jgi:rod shape determining protein RodA